MNMSPFLESFLNNTQVIFFLIDMEEPLLSILSLTILPVQTELLQEDLLFFLGALISILYIAHAALVIMHTVVIIKLSYLWQLIFMESKHRMPDIRLKAVYRPDWQGSVIEHQPIKQEVMV